MLHSLDALYWQHPWIMNLSSNTQQTLFSQALYMLWRNVVGCCYAMLSGCFLPWWSPSPLFFPDQAHGRGRVCVEGGESRSDELRQSNCHGSATTLSLHFHCLLRLNCQQHTLASHAQQGTLEGNGTDSPWSLHWSLLWRGLELGERRGACVAIWPDMWSVGQCPVARSRLCKRVKIKDQCPGQ